MEPMDPKEDYNRNGVSVEQNPNIVNNSDRLSGTSDLFQSCCAASILFPK